MPSNQAGRGKIYTDSAKGLRQPIDLISACLVFGLPLPVRKRTAEYDFDEPEVPVSRPDLADCHRTAMHDCVLTSGRSAGGWSF